MSTLSIFPEVYVASDAVSATEAGQAFFELHHRLHRFFDQTMCGAGLSLSRAKVLMRLSAGGPMNQSTLAGLLGFAPRSVTDTVDALERDGLVRRTEDPTDRRARIVELTDAGCKAHEASLIVRANTFEEIFGSLTTHERATFAALLAKISSTVPSGEINCGN